MLVRNKAKKLLTRILSFTLLTILLVGCSDSDNQNISVTETSTEIVIETSAELITEAPADSQEALILKEDGTYITVQS